MRAFIPKIQKFEQSPKYQGVLRVRCESLLDPKTQGIQDQYTAKGGWVSGMPYTNH
jgi:hypothetical protein